jgi:2-polyprenyl-3-methyl-5-hydroxy-6-metoxy-1,4-benzoquinol methylase
VRNWPAKFSIKNNSRVLDIGCGRGLLGEFLKHEYGCHVTGLEIIQENALVAETVLDKVIVGDIESMILDEIKESFDYVIFSDSLEHLLDPGKVLIRTASLLKPDSGELLISIPNVRNFRVTLPLLLKDEWRYTDEGLLDKTHLRFFTLKSIKRLLDESGFKVMNAFYDLPISSQSGIINRLTLGQLSNHLTSHYFIQACKRK